MRIGHGYDVHRYGENLEYVIGGVHIPCPFGMVAHSDGDVLAHALTDALLGAAGLGDIGTYFPDTDSAYENADSIELLKKAVAMLEEKHLSVNCADCTIIAQAPKMAPYIGIMRENLAAACGISPERLNVKATTEEKLGFTGRMEGVAAHAVCILDERG